MATESPSLLQLKEGLLLSFKECSERGLTYSANWAIELASSIETEQLPSIPEIERSPLFQSEYTQFCLGKSLYDLHEFKRAAYVLQNCKSNEAFFLRSYSTFLAGEKMKEDSLVDVIGPDHDGSIKNTELLSLKRDLAKREIDNQLDGYGYYLYGVVLRELEAVDEARKMLLRATHLSPLLWSAWKELGKLCEDREMLYSLDVPQHWLRDFFLAEASLELQLMDDSLAYYSNLSLVGFGASSYVNSQLAVVHYHKKDFAESETMFECVRKLDPYKITSLDIYSNVLFVMEKLPELSRLAQEVVKVEKYCSESCIVLGNFYGLHGDHEKAIVYFRRAVRLNRHDHSAWVLLGHEYMELRNCTMAIEAYCKGIEINKNDFRGYYGLGNAYEILKMPYFALHYFRQAHKLKPSDSRILFSLGYCYDQLGLNEEAKKCYRRAIAFKDQEGTSLVKLAKLHAKLGEGVEAAKLYTKFIAQAETKGVAAHLIDEQGFAHLFLARYHISKGSYSEAEAHAHKCTEFVPTRDEGKSVLQEAQRMKAAAQDSSNKSGVEELGSLDTEISPIS